MRERLIATIVCLALCFSLVGVLAPASPVNAATPIFVNGATGNNAWEAHRLLM